MNRFIAVVAIVYIGLGGCASPPSAPTVTAGLLSDASHSGRFVADRFSLRALGMADDAPASDEPPSMAGGTYAVWHIEFEDVESCEAFKVDGVWVFNQYGRWADAFAPRTLAAQQAIEKSKGFLWMDSGGQTTLPPAPPDEPVASRGTPEPIVRGGLSKLTGKGVTVAVVDTGLDFRHPDFITQDADGNPVSRVTLFWDTTSNDHDAKGIGDRAPIVVPGGASLGTVYTRDVLTEDLRAATPRIGAKDTHGHGTACAGIAAGNGRAYADRRYAGVAPEADLIAVRIGTTGNLPNAFLLGAVCTWLEQVAKDQPFVVSCSFGGQSGGRDGFDVLERQLDNHFWSGAKGRALCVAAGNEAEYRIHCGLTIGRTAGRMEWVVPDGGWGEVRVCFETDNLRQITWNSVGPTTITNDRLKSGIHGLTGQGWATFMTGPGTFAVEFTSKGGTIVADAYIRGGSAKYVSWFTKACTTASKMIGTPATTGQALSVGSYDFNDVMEVGGKRVTYGTQEGGPAPLTIGAISRYSNPGPRRTGDLMKPELVAPGQYHTAARAASTGRADHTETSGHYVYFNGTSAATPYCAGIVALMLQKRPDLTVGEIRELFRTRMSRDARTGALPNATWGYGKLDVKAARALLAAVKSR